MRLPRRPAFSRTPRNDKKGRYYEEGAVFSLCHCEEGAKRLTKQSLSPITAILRLPRRPAFGRTPRKAMKNEK